VLLANRWACHQDSCVLVITDPDRAGAVAAAVRLAAVEARRSDLRRVLGMLADYGLMCRHEHNGRAAGLGRGGDVGDGRQRHALRQPLPVLAVAMAMTGFRHHRGVERDYWQRNLALGIGLLVGLAAIPLYFKPAGG
jgi:two-component system sensor histidine kinase RpfC